jgi:ring-1,2-phenylacetyl-CoA epoxidase subunit PaaC
VVRLGDGTDESNRRAQAAVDALWRYTAEMFEGDAGVYVSDWQRQVEEVLDQAGLSVPKDGYQRSGGRRGFHSEHLGHLLAEMQWMQRSYPGQEW